jgi:hypothetical protein
VPCGLLLFLDELQVLLQLLFLLLERFDPSLLLLELVVYVSIVGLFPLLSESSLLPKILDLSLEMFDSFFAKLGFALERQQLLSLVVEPMFIFGVPCAWSACLACFFLF